MRNRVILAMAGLAVLIAPTVLAGEIKNPQKSIPQAAVISGIIIASIYILGTFSVLVALPASEINIISGFIQGIAAIGNKLGLGWTSNIMALLVTFGGIGFFSSGNCSIFAIAAFSSSMSLTNGGES